VERRRVVGVGAQVDPGLELAKGVRQGALRMPQRTIGFHPPLSNPRSGDEVAVPGKAVPHFRTGKELRERLQDLG
jgi:integration host factor subunit beta